MYKVMIVEDELFVRIGLEHAVNWEEYQMKLLPSASNGREALELYNKHHPDLIITDIKMPEMDGLELISAIRKKDRDMHFIVMTCMEDYQTVKRALNLSVSHYYNKCDLDIAELKSYLLEIGQALSIQSREKYPEEKEKPEVQSQLLWERFLFDGEEQKPAALLSASGIPQGTYALVRLDFDLPEDLRQNELYCSSILNLLKQIVTKQKLGHFLGARGQTVAILYAFGTAPEEACTQQITIFTKHLKQALESYFNVPSGIAVSPNFDRPDDIAAYWQDETFLSPLRESAMPSGKILAAVQYIQEHLSENLVLADVAKHANFSPGYLSDLFKRELQMGFGDFVINMRVKKAKQLLRQGDLKMSFIAEETGFYDASYFIKVFKRATGTTPSEYRRGRLWGKDREK